MSNDSKNRITAIRERLRRNLNRIYLEGGHGWIAKAVEEITVDVGKIEAELAAAREQNRLLREALETVERWAGSAGSGEVPAKPIAKIARDALNAAGERDEGKYGDWRDRCSGTGGNYGE